MALSIGIGVGIVLGILMVIWVRKRRKKLWEEKFQAAKKIREDSLREALANDLDPEVAAASATPYRPYQVDYSTGETKKNGEKLPLLQIIEKSKLSEKRYIFRANETVTLGLQFGSACVLNNLENGEGWCELFFQNDGYCVRALGRDTVSVQRNKHIALVDGRGIKLRSKDAIQIRDTSFQVFYVKGR